MKSPNESYLVACDMSVSFEQLIQFIFCNVFREIFHIHISEQFGFFTKFFLSFFTSNKSTNENLPIIHN